MLLSGMEKAKELIRKCKEEKSTFLDLGKMSLTELPDELFELGHLEHLTLGDFYLNSKNDKVESKNLGAPNRIEVINSKIKNLSNLTSLDLSSNKIQNVSFLEKLPNLTSLDFSSNKIQDISFLGKFSNLTSLDLSSNKIQDYSFLKEQTNLTSLYLNSNQIQDYSFLLKLINLTSLDLSSNKIQDYSLLEELTNLTSLNLNSNQIQDYSFLLKLTNLTSLDLSSNKIQDTSFLKELVNLTLLNLRSNQIQDISFSKELTNLTSLNLSSNQIQDISFLKELTNLASLNLSSNQIQDISFLKELINLTSLDLNSNQIQDVSFLKKLINLTSLDLNSNQIQDISFLKKLTNLASLDLLINKIEDTSFLKELTNLTSLSFNSNQIKDYSFLKDFNKLTSLGLSSIQIQDTSFLKELTNLTSLTFMGGQVQDYSFFKKLTNLTSLNFISFEIKDISFLHELKNLTFLFLITNQVQDYSILKELKNLTFLYLGNQIQDTSFLKELNKLTSLFLTNNQIKKFPKEVLNKKFLTECYLNNNPIKDIPYEIVNSDNSLTHAKNWFKDLDFGKANNYELKLIIIGNGRVGKTCVMKRMIYKAYDDKENSTHAIQIERWNKKLELKEENNLVKKDITINVWDFGGQDIYHSTHRLFLQSRAVFLLVWDAQTQIEKFTSSEKTKDIEYHRFQNFPLPYWLNYIRSLSKNSPVIITQNKVDRDKSQAIPNRDQVDKMYSHIHDYARISAKTGRGTEDLEEIIIDAFKQMPELGMEMPLRWYNVREKIVVLSSNEKDIPYQKYIDLCVEEKVREVSRPSLLRYLHDTGILFYKENLFENKIILDQKWVIEAVYTLFDREQIYFDYLVRGDGKFTLSELASKIWKNYSEEECKVFLSFMASCELCFELIDNQKNPIYLAPALLQKEKPSSVNFIFEEKKNDSLHLIYKYIFTQSAFIHRFIVKAKNLIEENELWKNGLSFSHQDTRAMVEIIPINNFLKNGFENEMEGIHIQVFGNNKVEILNRIKNEFEGIHRGIFDTEEYVSINGANYISLVDLEENRKSGIEKIKAQNGNVVLLNQFNDFLQKEKEDQFGREQKKKGIEELRKALNMKKENPNTVKIFISYSHKDEDYKKELDVHLSSLKRQNKIEVWEDRQIEAGGDWEKDIMDNIQNADIILLLISADFTASEFCYSIEMDIALKRTADNEAVTIPIIVRPCDWFDLPFAKFQSIPRDNNPIADMDKNKRDKAYLEVVNEIKEVVKKISS